MNVGSKVRCIASDANHGLVGTVVSSVGERRKVLFDRDAGKSQDDLALAYFYFWDELERV